jgi:hypothetical protein
MSERSRKAVVSKDGRTIEVTEGGKAYRIDVSGLWRAISADFTTRGSGREFGFSGTSIWEAIADAESRSTPKLNRIINLVRKAFSPDERGGE